MRRSPWKPISFVVVATVLLLFVILEITLQVSRRKVESLLRDVSVLSNSQDPTAYFSFMKRRYARDLQPKDYCTPSRCIYEVAITNKMPYWFRPIPRTGFTASFEIYDGSLIHVLMQYRSSRSDVPSPLVWVQQDIWTNPSIGCNWIAVDPHGRDVKQTAHGDVDLGRCATPFEKKVALNFDLECMTKLGGCKDISEMLPDVWKRTAPDAVSTRIRTWGDSIAERALPLPN